MPRHAQNPHHPLTRLRRQLSSPGHVFSREMLAQKTKIPLGSLKAIESGRYALTPELCAKISLGVPVNPFDLARGSDPLRDFTGEPLSAESVMLEKSVAPFLSQKAGFETDQYVERAAFAVAEKKFQAMQLRFLLREAFVRVLDSLGLTPLVAEELTAHLGEFDPDQVTYRLRPQKGIPAKQWEAFERLLRGEHDRLWKEKQDQDPIFRQSRDMSKREQRRLSLESAEFDQKLRAQALQNVAKSAAEPHS